SRIALVAPHDGRHYARARRRSRDVARALAAYPRERRQRLGAKSGAAASGAARRDGSDRPAPPHRRTVSRHDGTAARFLERAPARRAAPRNAGRSERRGVSARSRDGLRVAGACVALAAAAVRAAGSAGPAVTADSWLPWLAAAWGLVIGSFLNVCI